MSWKKLADTPGMFDFQILTSTQPVLFLISFIGTFFVLTRWQKKYAGLIPAIIAVLMSIFVIDDTVLKIGLGVAAVLVVIVGWLDESRPLSAAAQLFWQIVIAIILVLSGWIIPYVSNPLGPGVWPLGTLAFPATIIWIVLMMNVMNWLDGLDGLASSVSIVAFLTLAGISLLPATQDATTLSLSLIAAGALLGFFLHNAPPAKVYLGTTGSWFIGMFLALAAAVSGGKVATATLVLALPVLDAGFVIMQRLLHKQPPWRGDKSHLHHHLLAAGVSSRQIITTAVIITGLLGYVAVTAQTLQKLWALAAVALFMAVTILTLSHARTATHR